MDCHIETICVGMFPLGPFSSLFVYQPIKFYWHLPTIPISQVLFKSVNFFYDFLLHSQKRYRLVASFHFYWLVATCQQVQQVCQFHQAATSLLTTCNKPIDNLKQTCCHKPCEHILISACCNKLLQDVNRLLTTWAFFGCVIQWAQISSKRLTNELKSLRFICCFSNALFRKPYFFNQIFFFTLRCYNSQKITIFIRQNQE